MNSQVQQQLPSTEPIRSAVLCRAAACYARLTGQEPDGRAVNQAKRFSSRGDEACLRASAATAVALLRRRLRLRRRRHRALVHVRPQRRQQRLRELPWQEGLEFPVAACSCVAVEVRRREQSQYNQSSATVTTGGLACTLTGRGEWAALKCLVMKAASWLLSATTPMASSTAAASIRR